MLRATAPSYVRIPPVAITADEFQCSIVEFVNLLHALCNSFEQLNINSLATSLFIKHQWFPKGTVCDGHELVLSYVSDNEYQMLDSWADHQEVKFSKFDLFWHY